MKQIDKKVNKTVVQETPLIDTDDEARKFLEKPVSKIAGIHVKVRHIPEDRSIIIYDSEHPIELIFGGDGKRTATLSDGTKVFIAKTTEFHPLCGRKYLCSIQFRHKGGKNTGYARPALPYTLTTEEVSPLLTQLVREVIFRQGDRGPVSNDKETGKIILPQSKGEDAWSPEAGKKYTCVVYETDTCFIAEELNSGIITERALVVKMIKKGKADQERLKYIVWGERYEEIYSLLSKAFEKSKGKEGLMVDALSTKEQIEKAFRGCSKMFHSDTILAGQDVSKETRTGVDKFFKALEEAKGQAIDLIKIRKEGKK